MHILLNNSFSYKKRETITPPKGFSYDKNRGAWISDSRKHLLVNDKRFAGVATKKRDIETGEDQK